MTTNWQLYGTCYHDNKLTTLWDSLPWQQSNEYTCISRVYYCIIIFYIMFTLQVTSCVNVRRGRAFQDTFVHNELYVLSLNIWIVFASFTNVSCTTGVTCGTGTAHPSGTPCRSLFVFCSFSVLSVLLRLCLLITPLVSSNFSHRDKVWD